MSMDKSALEAALIELAPSSNGNQIKWMPDDLVAIIQDKRGFDSKVKTAIVTPFDLLEFVDRIKKGELLILPINQVLEISDSLGKSNPHPSHLFPVMRDGFVVFILLYSYPNFRFMDWIDLKTNIRLSGHICIAGIK